MLEDNILLTTQCYGEYCSVVYLWMENATARNDKMCKYEMDTAQNRRASNATRRMEAARGHAALLKYIHTHFIY